jgi:hypothetical protein
VLYKNRHGLIGAKNELQEIVLSFGKRINPFSSENKLKGAEIMNFNKKPETFKNVSRLQGAPLESSSNFVQVPEKKVKINENVNSNVFHLNNSIHSVIKHGCNESKWGCCPDNRTSSNDYYGSNCWDYPLSSGKYLPISDLNEMNNSNEMNKINNSNGMNKINKPETFNSVNKVNSMKELFDQKQSGWILSHTKVSPDCCPSTYTTSTGCICDDQLFVNTQFPTANRDPCAASFMKSNLLGLSAPTTYIDSESVMNSENNTLAKSVSEPVPNQRMVESVFYKSDKMGQTY